MPRTKQVYNIGPRKVFQPSLIFVVSTRAQCYHIFYVGNSQMFVIRQSVCLWLAFKSQSNVCGSGQEEPTLESSTGKVLHYDRLSLTRKHQTKLERLARGKHSSLLRIIVNYRSSFITLGSGDTLQSGVTTSQSTRGGLGLTLLPEKLVREKQTPQLILVERK